MPSGFAIASGQTCPEPASAARRAHGRRRDPGAGDAGLARPPEPPGMREAGRARLDRRAPPPIIDHPRRSRSAGRAIPPRSSHDHPARRPRARSAAGASPITAPRPAAPVGRAGGGPWVRATASVRGRSTDAPPIRRDPPGGVFCERGDAGERSRLAMPGHGPRGIVPTRIARTGGPARPPRTSAAAVAPAGRRRADVDDGTARDDPHGLSRMAWALGTTLTAGSVTAAGASGRTTSDGWTARQPGDALERQLEDG